MSVIRNTIILLEELPPDFELQLCELLDEGDAWERVVKTFLEVKIDLFSIKTLRQEKYPSSPGQKLVKSLKLYKFSVIDMYKILAKTNLLNAMNCLKDFVSWDIRQKIEVAMKQTIPVAQTHQNDASISYIHQLPEDVRKRLCTVLDANNSWKHLLGKFQDAGFVWAHIEEFSLKCPTSPSSELLRQLADRNFQITLLYTALALCQLLQAMSFLECYVSENLRNTLASNSCGTQTSIPKVNNVAVCAPSMNQDAIIKPSSPTSEGCNETSYMQLEQATGGWSQYIKGNFFHGRLSERDVAIKRLHIKNKSLRNVVLKELRVLLHADHENVCKMLKFLEGNCDPCLIYPYMKNRSLYDVLKNQMNPGSTSGEGSSPISWKNKEDIAIGIAEALLYLHMCFECAVVVKSSDILLDNNLKPKVADACLPCFLDESASGDLSRYLPQERWNQYENLDSFCLGTILLELAFGNPADTFQDHPEKFKSSLAKKGFVKTFPFDNQAGVLGESAKKNWLASVKLCYENADIAGITDCLNSKVLLSLS